MTRGTRKEWAQGWPLVALTIIGITCAPTVLPPYTIGLFVAPLEQEFGWSRAGIQAGIMFSTGLGVVSGPLAGWLIQRLGVRMTILTGMMGMALALAFGATIGVGIWQLYLTYALIALLGAGAGAVSWSFLIADRFESSRGLALGVALSGTGVAAVIMPRITAISMEMWDWRGAYLALAGFVALIILPICFFVLPRNEPSHEVEHGHATVNRPGFSLTAAARQYRFWILGASTAFIYLAIGGLVPNMIPVLTSNGLPTEDAVSIMSLFGLAVITGRIAIGALVDRFWAPAVATAVLLPAAAGCIVLGTDTTFTIYAIAAVIVGASTGMEMDMLGFLVARYFGLADYARIYGRIFIFLAAAAGVAPVAYGAFYDYTRSYELALLISSILLCAGAAGLLALGRYPALPADDVTRSDAG